jgi:hypothetical protein
MPEADSSTQCDMSGTQVSAKAIASIAFTDRTRNRWQERCQCSIIYYLCVV